MQLVFVIFLSMFRPKYQLFHNNLFPLSYIYPLGDGLIGKLMAIELLALETVDGGLLRKFFRMADGYRNDNSLLPEVQWNHSWGVIRPKADSGPESGERMLCRLSTTTSFKLY